MKITGEDGKTYESVEECLKADQAFKEEQEKKALEASEKKTALSKKKKEMADAIQAAEESVSTALTEYDAAKGRAREIVANAEKEANAVLKEARDKYVEATGARWRAIKSFNDEFGTYTTTYTGRRALEEWNRALKATDEIIDSFFKRIWF